MSLCQFPLYIKRDMKDYLAITHSASHIKCHCYSANVNSAPVSSRHFDELLQILRDYCSYLGKSHSLCQLMRSKKWGHSSSASNRWHLETQGIIKRKVSKEQQRCRSLRPPCIHSAEMLAVSHCVPELLSCPSLPLFQQSKPSAGVWRCSGIFMKSGSAVMDSSCQGWWKMHADYC